MRKLQLHWRNHVVETQCEKMQVSLFTLGRGCVSGKKKYRNMFRFNLSQVTYCLKEIAVRWNSKCAAFEHWKKTDWFSLHTLLIQDESLESLDLTLISHLEPYFFFYPYIWCMLFLPPKKWIFLYNFCRLGGFFVTRTIVIPRNCRSVLRILPNHLQHMLFSATYTNFTHKAHDSKITK